MTAVLKLDYKCSIERVPTSKMLLMNMHVEFAMYIINDSCHFSFNVVFHIVYITHVPNIT